MGHLPITTNSDAKLSGHLCQLLQHLLGADSGSRGFNLDLYVHNTMQLGLCLFSQEAPSRGHRRPGVGPTCDVVGRARPLPLPPVVRSDDRFCTSTGPSGRVFTSCSGARALGGSSSCGRCGVPRWYGYGRLDEGGTHHRRARQRELNGWGRCVHRVPLLMSSPDLGSAGYVPEATW